MPSHSAFDTVTALPPSPSAIGAIGARGERRQAELAGDRHRRQHVRHIEMPDREPVADIGPGGLAHSGEVDALRRGKALLLGHDQQGAVEQRHEAGGDLMCAGIAQSSSRSKQSGGRDQALRDVGDLAVLVHRRLAQQRVGLRLR